MTKQEYTYTATYEFGEWRMGSHGIWNLINGRVEDGEGNILWTLDILGRRGIWRGTTIPAVFTKGN